MGGMKARIRPYPVSAVIPTRGNVDMAEVLESLPFDDVVVYDNSKNLDLRVYGRYAVLDRLKHPLVYVQDDDVVLEPESIRDLVRAAMSAPVSAVVANMPERFRHPFYDDHCLVGFGAVFHRAAPAVAFRRFAEFHSPATLRLDDPGMWLAEFWPSFTATCDIVFTGLSEPRVLVDVPYRDRVFASDPDRMWRQPSHQVERNDMLTFVQSVAR